MQGGLAKHKQVSEHTFWDTPPPPPTTEQTNTPPSKQTSYFFLLRATLLFPLHQ